MERAVSALELEKNVLLFPDGAALEEGCNFRGETHHSGGTAAHDSRDMSDVAFRRQLRTAGCQRVLQRSDILIELLELEGFVILRALDRVCLEMIQSRRKYQPVGVEAFGDGLFHLQGRRRIFSQRVFSCWNQDLMRSICRLCFDWLKRDVLQPT